MLARGVLTGVALAGLMAFSSHAYAVTVETSDFISSPADFDGFESFTQTFVGNGPYTEGGITVQYVGTPTGGTSSGIWTTFTNGIGGQGNHGWYANGGGYGYTDITLANSADFQNVQFLVGTGNPTATPIEYELLENGVVVASGNSPGTKQTGPMTYLGFSGGGFDEIWLQSLHDGGPDFLPTGYEGLALDSIAANGNVVATTPLPSTFGFLATSLGVFGFLTRRTKQTDAPLAT